MVYKVKTFVHSCFARINRSDVLLSDLSPFLFMTVETKAAKINPCISAKVEMYWGKTLLLTTVWGKILRSVILYAPYLLVFVCCCCFIIISAAFVVVESVMQ